ncbi:MAG: hypothetical protein AAGF13_10650 [Pseudomonadota bacterium]
MQSRVIRIEGVSFDAAESAYAARITYVSPIGLERRDLKVAGHRSWAAHQIITALKKGVSRPKGSFTHA